MSRTACSARSVIDRASSSSSALPPPDAMCRCACDSSILMTVSTWPISSWSSRAIDAALLFLRGHELGRQPLQLGGRARVLLLLGAEPALEPVDVHRREKRDEQRHEHGEPERPPEPALNVAIERGGLGLLLHVGVAIQRLQLAGNLNRALALRNDARDEEISAVLTPPGAVGRQHAQVGVAKLRKVAAEPLGAPCSVRLPSTGT